ncbi:cell wall-associated NlpC family hydrolase [Luteibacter sp. Sphag1AF]|uniref:C40 family peptidase n=1 Tax=Luteibacter sp. Sphag1AF TaxID=2587031 RepID=UPI00161FB04B|nr:C40 family peptidase [Luteibacter sp. Sphag1AF]MBB3228916.1 cell wall-associated NlpC family hydrolase [Luteibacter sp. Sphag1AF]
MHLKRLTALALALTCAASVTPVLAETITVPSGINDSASLLLTDLPVFAPATALAQSVVPDAASITKPAQALAKADKAPVDDADDGDDAGDLVADATDKLAGHVDGDARNVLMSFAMKLRDIRYKRGGRQPSTGFDCSGFVRYVFRHSIGLDLPANSASQFLAGLKVKRSDMKTGDLVFFRTRGKAISHVGIYIDNGQFIHSPSAGKTVRVDNLNEAYWAKHFVGAKRPEGIARI